LTASADSSAKKTIKSQYFGYGHWIVLHRTVHSNGGKSMAIKEDVIAFGEWSPDRAGRGRSIPVRTSIAGRRQVILSMQGGKTKKGGGRL